MVSIFLLRRHVRQTVQLPLCRRCITQPASSAPSLTSREEYRNQWKTSEARKYSSNKHGDHLPPTTARTENHPTAAPPPLCHLTAWFGTLSGLSRRVPRLMEDHQDRKIIYQPNIVSIFRLRPPVWKIVQLPLYHRCVT